MSGNIGNLGLEPKVVSDSADFCRFLGSILPTILGVLEDLSSCLWLVAKGSNSSCLPYHALDPVTL